MRLLQLSVPAEQRAAIREVLDGHDLGYTVAEGDGAKEGHALVTVVIPADAVERVLDDLQEAGYERSTYTVSTEAEFATFEGMDAVQRHWAETPNRIAPETLRAKARDMRPNTQSYVWLMLLSTVIATAGLLIGSPAVLVGSMVLAPLVAPMLAASIGAVRSDRPMVADSLRQQAVGLGVAVVGAVAASLLIRNLEIVSVTLDVTTVDLFAVRLSPGLLSVVVGLAAGAAGAFGLTTKGNVSIVGVMVAAALVPTAAVVGIGVAWGAASVALGALVLLGLTIVAVNAGAYLMLRYLGYRPEEAGGSFIDLESTAEKARFAATVLAVAAVVAVVLVGSAQHVRFEYAVTQATSDVISDEEYGPLSLRGVTVQYAGASPVRNPTTVSVSLTRRSDESYPSLPNELARQISDRTGEDVTVLVTYTDYEISNATGTRSGADATSLARSAAPS
ncbi:TIGR00341 family protein [Halosimplex rubrum]|uniref:TIGR00341 family protein n=1 Tax=Halosimplex rubrum TaxID=869889 RepID=A0A7D5PC69_9EURY|nr:TIGR00341 family protein [Halosimplex rubrum]QLH79079.1 TIGR00341 family protein [Halosimplex rubrum]